MSKFDDVKNHRFKCDGCKKEFSGSEVKLVEAADNINILSFPMPFKYVDKNNTITGGSEQPSKEKGDRVLACPNCKQIHLFGMDPA